MQCPDCQHELPASFGLLRREADQIARRRDEKCPVCRVTLRIDTDGSVEVVQENEESLDDVRRAEELVRPTPRHGYYIK